MHPLKLNLRHGIACLGIPLSIITALGLTEVWSRMTIEDGLRFRPKTTMYQEMPTVPSNVAQAQLEELSRLAIVEPEEFSRRYPQERTAEEVRHEAEAVFAITHPTEFKRLKDSFRSSEELAEEALVIQFFVNPALYRAAMEASLTPEERQARDKAVAAMLGESENQP